MIEQYRKALEQEKREDGNIGQPISGPVQHALANEMLYLAGRRNEMTAEGASLEAFEQIQERHKLDCPGGHWRYWTNWEKEQMEKPEGIPSPVYPRSAKCWNGIDTLWRLNKRERFKERWPELEQVEKLRMDAEIAVYYSTSRFERQFHSAKQHFAKEILITFGGMWNGQAMPPGHLRNHVLGTEEIVKASYHYLNPEYQAGMTKWFNEYAEMFLRLAEAMEMIQEEQLAAWRATGWGWQGAGDDEGAISAVATKAQETPPGAEKALSPEDEEAQEYSDNYIAVFKHIDMTRNKWTREQNPGHWERWDEVEHLINNGYIEDAIDYAVVHANKGWKPWSELVEMLEKVK